MTAALLHDALERHDAAAARSLLEQHAELRATINEPVFAFNSPAIVAFSNDAALVDVLLDFGADPNRRSDWWAGGFHALYGATGAVAERLLAAGAIPDACAAAHLDRIDLLVPLIMNDRARVRVRGGDGQTPLHFAASRKVVDFLLSAGADIEARDIDHRSTAAEWMISPKRGQGRYDLARYLVERDASADIFLATALGFPDRVRAMLQKDASLLDLRTSRGEYGEKPPSSFHIYRWTIGDSRSPMDVAAQYEQQATLEVMLEFASPVQHLLLACRRGEEAAARAMLHERPNMITSLRPDDHRAVADAAWNGDARAVKLMLALGFDPRVPGYDTGTALHCAVYEGSVECVEALLQRPDARELVALRDTHYHGTPLAWCCHASLYGNRTRDYARIARMLLDAGARRSGDSPNASPAVLAVLNASAES